MRTPAKLSKGLTEEQQNQLERELTSSVLAKQLRLALKSGIEATYEHEEVEDITLEHLSRTIGERRGLRSVLKLLPEE